MTIISKRGEVVLHYLNAGHTCIHQEDRKTSSLCWIVKLGNHFYFLNNVTVLVSAKLDGKLRQFCEAHKKRGQTLNWSHNYKLVRVKGPGLLPIEILTH